MSLKTICITILSLSTLSLCLQAKEEAKVDLTKIKHPVKPMLWKIEGKGLVKPSYLFGTIHLGDPRISTLHPLAQQAFDQAGTLFTEVNLSVAHQVRLTKWVLRNDEKTLEELIGEKNAAALERELKAINPAFGLKPFQKFHVWAIAMTLPQFAEQLEQKQALDIQLWQRAEKAGKKTGALESPKDQLGQFNKFSIEEQNEILSVTLAMMERARAKGVDPHQEFVDAYLHGDAAAIVKLIQASSYMGLKLNKELNDKFLKLLIVDRNERMAESIQKALSSPEAGSHFFAAGTAHYTGEKSVNEYLTKAGYSVTRVNK